MATFIISIKAKLIQKDIQVGYQFTNGLSWMDMDEMNEFEEAKKIFENRGELD